MLRSCCVTRYLRRSAEADLFGERPSLCAVPDTWENRVSGTSAAFPREHTSLRGSMRVFFFSRAPAETANGASSWFAQTKDLWSPRTSHSRPQLFQSKWIGFAAPLAPGRIFTGGSWLKVAGASEPSVHVDSLPVIFGSRTVRRSGGNRSRNRRDFPGARVWPVVPGLSRASTSLSSSKSAF